MDKKENNKIPSFSMEELEANFEKRDFILNDKYTANEIASKLANDNMFLLALLHCCPPIILVTNAVATLDMGRSLIDDQEFKDIIRNHASKELTNKTQEFKDSLIVSATQLLNLLAKGTFMIHGFESSQFIKNKSPKEKNITTHVDVNPKWKDEELQLYLIIQDAISAMVKNVIFNGSVNVKKNDELTDEEKFSIPNPFKD